MIFTNSIHIHLGLYFMPLYVYILECSDGSYYTGITRNVEKRLVEHANQKYPDCYTATRLPVKLVWKHGYMYYSDAISAEKRIKDWRREKKVALINGEYDVPLIRKTEG